MSKVELRKSFGSIEGSSFISIETKASQNNATPSESNNNSFTAHYTIKTLVYQNTTVEIEREKKSIIRQHV